MEEWGKRNARRADSLLTMIEQDIEIRTPDGVSDGILYGSEDGSRLPGVIFLTDIRGIRPSQREMARRLAAEGYTVLMPNVFYRTRRPPIFDFPMKMGEERTMTRFAELTGPLTPDAAERDASAYVDFLRVHQSVSKGVMGVVGYCFSGALALRAAAACPDRIAAAASFHGARLFTDSPGSPHLVLPRIKARLYFGHADQDQSMPAEAIAKLNDALRNWGGLYSSELYEGAHHGWTVPDNPAYNQAQAERAFARLRELFGPTLQTPVS
jgi:carboxymethylenebutenolidase